MTWYLLGLTQKEKIIWDHWVNLSSDVDSDSDSLVFSGASGLWLPHQSVNFLEQTMLKNCFKPIYFYCSTLFTGLPNKKSRTQLCKERLQLREEERGESFSCFAEAYCNLLLVISEQKIKNLSLSKVIHFFCNKAASYTLLLTLLLPVQVDVLFA